MSDHDDNQEVARLERLNEELSDSLRRCRMLLRDYGARIAANSNEVEISRGDEESREA